MYIMYRIPASLSLLAFSILQTQAAHIIDNLSFGVHQHVADQNHKVPGWHVTGSDYTPEVLSDRIILTPPYPGSKRGSIWSENTLSETEWNADVEFRVGGQERGGGNMQVWYARDGLSQVGTASLYSVHKFEGLVLVVDQYGGMGGSVRGFLNDGLKSFNSQHNVDSLAFGHCDFSYRNLGHWAHLSIKQTRDSFEVSVNDHSCFKTHKVHLPSGYHFGVSAASADTPDSFELASFIVENESANVGSERASGSDQQPLMGSTKGRREPSHESAHEDDGWHYYEDTDIPDTAASDYRSQDEQFKDLHTRLVLMHHQLDNLMHDFKSVKINQEEHKNILVDQHLNPLHHFQEEMHLRIANIEHDIDKIKNDIASKDYRQTLQQLQDALRDSHSNILFHMPDVTKAGHPRLGFFVFLILAFQAMLAGSYIVYKRRKNSGPKKYL